MWKKFFDSIPGDRDQTLEITDVGGKVTVGEKTCLEVFAIDADTGDEYNGVGRREGQGILVPEDAKIEFDPKTYQMSGGRISSTGNSYAEAGHDWKIPTNNATKMSVKALEKLITA